MPWLAMKRTNSRLMCLCIIFLILSTSILCEGKLEKLQTTSRNGCAIPNVEGTKYSNNDSNVLIDFSPGSLVAPATFVIENCEDGYHSTLNHRFMLCSNYGYWMPSYLDKLCSKKCQPLTSDSLDMKCTLNGKTVDCHQPSEPGTTLTPSCRVTHSLGNRYANISRELTCSAFGSWIGVLYQCIPNCGRPHIPSKITILNGNNASYGSAPWNVGIYRRNEQNTYEQICGGSLIAPNLVVSAAQCFWNGNSTNKTSLTDMSMYKIGVGKYDRDISVIDNDHTQIMDVQIIHKNNDSDIAMVVLTKKVKLSNVVMPVCIDWFLNYTLQNGINGTIVGWGLSNRDNLSQRLLKAELTYIKLATCINMFSTRFRWVVTYKQFCTDSKSGQVIQTEDSGAGLTFGHSRNDNTLHYLAGVAINIKDPELNNRISIFADISFHLHWIRHIYINNHGENNKDKAYNEKCQPLSSDSLDFKCTLEGKKVDCSKPSNPGTKLKPSCKDTHTMPTKGEENAVELHCLSDGKWSGDLHKCISKKCLHFPAKCDGVIDCLDGSDEENCFRSTETARTQKNNEETQISIGSMTQYNPKKRCVVPNTKGTKYSFYNSSENGVLTPGSLVDENRVVEENCEDDYHKVVAYRYIICLNASWTPSVSSKLCLKKCQPLASDTLDIICTLNGEEVDCSKPSAPGTTLTPSCKVTHTIPNGGVESPVKLRCLEDDGKWSGDLYTCVPNCGRPYIPNKPLILNGEKANTGTAPWNVGIYKKNEHNSYEQICGGSLIAQNLVVTAAHCFGYYAKVTNNDLTNENALYKIVVGKYDRNFSVIDNSFTQIMDVRFLYRSRAYYGPIGYYANDIAIVVLTKKVQLSDIVMPVCMDWGKRYTIHNGAQGKVVGWGINGNGTSSSILLEANLTYIDQDTCRDLITDDFKIFMSIDKFCADSKLGQSVQPGDSGAGLTFLHSRAGNDLHYLNGIVSIKSPNETVSMALFTDVAEHISWIEAIYKNVTSTGDNNNRVNNPV